MVEPIHQEGLTARVACPIVAIGTMTLDTVETPHGEARNVPGGSALYFSAAASVFASVTVVGIVGSDFPWDEVAFLERRGVDLSHVRREPGATFRWRARYAADLETRETLEDRRGVSAGFRPRIPDALGEAGVIFLGSTDPWAQLEALEALPGAGLGGHTAGDSGRPGGSASSAPRPARALEGPDRRERGRRSRPLVACDTMLHWIEDEFDAVNQVAARSDVLFVNEEEALALGAKRDPHAAASCILDRGPRWVVVKRGARGATLFGADPPASVPAFPVERVRDPTGAGDTFAGGFLGFLAAAGRASAETLREALLHASVMGAFAVEDFSMRRLRAVTPAAVARRVARLKAGAPEASSEPA